MSDANDPIPEDGRVGADLSNWLTGPFISRAFQNVEEIIPCATIAAPIDDAEPLAKAPGSFSEFRLSGSDDVSLDIDQFQAATATDGLLISLDGKIVHEFYRPGMTAATPHILMSASKSIMGLILGILTERGVLCLETPVSDIVPEVARSAYHGVTLRRLTDMRAGIAFDAAELSAYEAAGNWRPPASDDAVSDIHGFLEWVRGSPSHLADNFAYISANTDLLGWVVERVTGKSYAALVSDLLWKPMRAEHDGYVTLDRKGAPRCTGGIGATLRDFARVGHLVMEGGVADGAQVVPEAWIDDIANTENRDAWKSGEWSSLFPYRGMSYRSGWYVVDDEPRTLFAMGIHGQNLFVDRANRLVVAKLSSQVPRVDYPAWMLTHRALPEIRRILGC